MLSKALWLDAALRANMKPGERRRFPHDCGPGDVVLVSCDNDGLHAFCFRCSESYTHHVQRSTKDIIKSLKQRQQAEQELEQKVELPNDCTSDLPTEARLWLARASIRQEEIHEYRIVYSPRAGRVLIPVFKGSELYAIQARAIGDIQPKYLNFGERTVFASLQHLRPKIALRNFSVFTEDILSAIRVGRFTQAYALTGTSAPVSELPDLTRYQSLILWLDGDKAGIKGMSRLRKQLNLLHEDVRVLVTPRDPKCYPDRLIAHYLKEITSADVRNYRAPHSEVPGRILPAPIRY